ncbi:MAG: class I SAM-dependent methyltransferase [Pseudomonadota bacterium]|nr:MAG: class I SAM-dependent methyltransferase [Pseudomonadota bacterium]
MKRNPSIDSLLAQAAALEASDRAAAGRLYRDILQQDPACIQASNALERLVDPGRFSHWMRVNCVIHPDDDIFRFFVNDPHSFNPVRDYLADGWRTLSELMVLLERHDRPLLGMSRVLEFACGFGRFTRHLAPLLPGRLTCADVLPGSVDFVTEQFGVDGLCSSFDPRSLVFPQRYELIFVLSLFTHLPVAQWRVWLRVLAGALAPDGLLVLSVHNEGAAADFGIEFEPDGTFFAPSSESPSLDPAHYGTTFTTRAVVEREIAGALGRLPDDYRPLAFWVGQDAVVIRRG